MAATPTPVFPQTPLSNLTQFTSTTSTSVPTSILAAQTNGALIEDILVTNSDTVAHDVNLYITVSSVNYQIGTISIPSGAGFTDTIPAVNLLAAVTSGSPLLPLPLDVNGNPYLYLSSAASLEAIPAVALASGKFINFLVMGGAF